MRSIKPTTIRLDDEDMKLVEIIKKKYGQSSLIGALRAALRVAASANDLAHDSHVEKVAPSRRITKPKKPSL